MTTDIVSWIFLKNIYSLTRPIVFNDRAIQTIPEEIGIIEFPSSKVQNQLHQLHPRSNEETRLSADRWWWLGSVLVGKGRNCWFVRDKEAVTAPKDQPLQELLRDSQKRHALKKPEKASQGTRERESSGVEPTVRGLSYLRYNFFPVSYMLPSEYVIFVDEFKRQQNDKAVWIMKPTARSQGKGIFLFNKLSSVSAW